jgi:prolyl oligopeptidase
MFKRKLIYPIFLIVISCSQSIEMPESRTVQHVDNYHGTLVADPYRWLEDFTSTEVKEWVNAQNYFTESFLENPNRLAIRENLESIWVSESISTPYKVQDKTFYYFNSGDWQQSKFMVKDCDACDPRVLLDPNTFSTDGTIALASVSVSPNAELLAFAISDGGSDWRSWKVLNIESGEELDDNLVWSKFSGAEWASDSSGFFYNKYPTPTNEALADLNSSPAVMFHTIGQNQSEDKIAKQDLSNPKLSWSIQVSDDGLYKVLYTSKGTDERNLIAIAEYASEEFIPLVTEFVADYSFIDSFENTLWFYTDHNAPNGKVVTGN